MSSEIIIIILFCLQSLIAIHLLYDGISIINGHHFFFMVGFIFYMLLFPLLYLLGLTNPSSSADLFKSGLWISFVGIFAYLIGRTFFNKLILKRKNNEIVFNRKLESSFIKHFGNRFKTNLLISIFVLFAFSLFVNIGYFNLPIIFLVFGGILSLQYERRRTLLFFTAIFALYFVSFSSGRRDIIGVVISSYVIFQYYGWVSTLKKIYSLVITSIVIISTSLYVTVSRSFDGSNAFISDLTRILYLGYGSVTKSFLALGDFGVSYDNYLQIINRISEIGYLWGVSFFRIFFAIIPRKLWPEKPLDVQQLIISQDIALFTYAGGSSQGMTLIGEFYWNFGLIAVFFGMFLFGILMSLMDKFLLSRNSTIAMVSISFVPFAFFAWRGAFNSSLIYFVLTAFLLILIYKLSDFFQKLLRNFF